jgi:hypothetical protein
MSSPSSPRRTFTPLTPFGGGLVTDTRTNEVVGGKNLELVGLFAVGSAPNSPNISDGSTCSTSFQGVRPDTPFSAGISTVAAIRTLTSETVKTVKTQIIDLCGTYGSNNVNVDGNFDINGQFTIAIAVKRRDGTIFKNGTYIVPKDIFTTIAPLITKFSNDEQCKISDLTFEGADLAQQPVSRWVLIIKGLTKLAMPAYRRRAIVHFCQAFDKGNGDTEAEFQYLELNEVIHRVSFNGYSWHNPQVLGNVEPKTNA